MKVLFRLSILLFTAMLFGQDKVVETFSQTLPGKDRAAFKQAHGQTYDWVLEGHVPGSERLPISIAATEQDLMDIEDFNCKSCGPTAVNKMNRVGVVKSVGVNVDFRDMVPVRGKKPMRLGAGMVTRLAGGDLAWTTTVTAEDATAVRIRFTDFDLPKGAAVFVYNDEGQAFGPYTDSGPIRGSAGDFWSNTIFGDIAFIQVRTYGSVDHDRIKFNIEEIAYLGDGFLIPGVGHAAGKAFCSFNESCIVDAQCYTGVTQVSGARDAVAHMQYVRSPYVYICSGGLLNDTDTTTTIPYFLTANHCISSQSVANTLETFWAFETSSCGGACYDPDGAVPSVLGSTLRSTGSTGDYTLLELPSFPATSVTLLGWTTAAIANSNGADLYRIHHPKGAPQAYSRHDVSTSAGTCGSWPRGSWIYSYDAVGATEGGSSGSPVLNSSGQVVGQLSGACGFNPSVACDSSNATVDGAFAAYFNNISAYLDPSTGGGGGSTMHVASITMTVDSIWIWRRVIMTVVIQDENNAAVSGANVTVSVTGPGGGSGTAATDGSGTVSFGTGWTTSGGNWTGCVTNVTHPSLTYDSADNVETCDTN
ncbi:MAG: serine protease [Acidobacteriota bacterium]|nr:serine protease [Acidobacteriota bacterium]